MNYYDVLRIDKNASSQEIKEAYKKLIKRYHPDLYPGNKVRAESITRDLNEAYEVLSDPDKKAIYDLSLQEPVIAYYKENFDSEQNQSQEFSIERNEFPNFEEKLKENIHHFVEEKSKKISSRSKRNIIFVILFISLCLCIITILDYINFQNIIQEKHEITKIENVQVEMYE